MRALNICKHMVLLVLLALLDADYQCVSGSAMVFIVLLMRTVNKFVPDPGIFCGASIVFYRASTIFKTACTIFKTACKISCAACICFKITQ